jgi:hypothetical protein
MRYHERDFGCEWAEVQWYVCDEPDDWWVWATVVGLAPWLG